MDFRTCLLASIVPLSMAACVTTRAPVQQSLATFPFHHDAFDLKVAWKTASAPQGALLDGVLQNVRYVQMLDVAVDVVLLSPDKEVLARGRSFTSPNRIDQNEHARFDLTLAGAPPAKGNLLQFIIKYTAIDDVSSSFYWVSSFTADALTGAVVESY